MKTKVRDLIPYVNNARSHSSAQVDAIAASIKEYGFLAPVIVHNNTILAGHARVLAAEKLGIEEVPAIDASHLTETQKKGYILADNRYALSSTWDEELLRLEFEALREDNFDLSLTGFTDAEIDSLIVDILDEADGEESVGPQDEGEDTGEAIQLGDVWILGDHRLICGDSTDPIHVGAVLGGALPELMVTDPPYGVNYDLAWREKALGGRRTTGVVLNDDRASWQAAYELFPGHTAYVWHSELHRNVFVEDLETAGFEIKTVIIWAKQHFVLSRGDYHWKHEPCLYAVRDTTKRNWQGMRDQSTVWEIKNTSCTGGSTDEDTKTNHSTQKPLECMLRPILNSSARGSGVYDPFGGSGTTLIACEKSDRKCYMIELNPEYCATIINRWQDLTGKEAILEATGETYGARRQGGADGES